MGGAPGAPNVDQLSLEYTSTRSIFNMSVADKVDMRVEFLSPVYPDDLRRQSVPFSYINVAVKSRDGKSHRVQVYSDVSGGQSEPLGTLDTRGCELSADIRLLRMGIGRHWSSG